MKGKLPFGEALAAGLKSGMRAVADAMLEHCQGMPGCSGKSPGPRCGECDRPLCLDHVLVRHQMGAVKVICPLCVKAAVEAAEANQEEES